MLKITTSITVIVIVLLNLFTLTLTKYTSGESIYEMTKLSTVNPEPHNCAIFPCEFYIWGSQATKPETAALTCLGYVGALGALGPLGPLGPLGSNSYDPSSIFKLFVNWEAIRKYIMANGPLTHPEGPMSKYGPLGDSYFFVMPRINDFTKHMMQFGIWSILGPIGPLGALGGLGPLGPIGSHGFKRNSTGDYVNKNNEIVTSAEAIWESSKRISWQLFERYTFSRCQELSKERKLDTSFMTSTSVGLTPDSYTIKSNENQIISIVVVPNLMNYQFVLEILNSNNQVIASSSTVKVINWVQFQANSNDFYTVQVKSHRINCLTSIGCTGVYTLHVVGSTQKMLRSSPIPYTGQYILN